MMTEYMKLGGVMMWPLLICSVFLGAVLIERTWTIVLLHGVFRRRLKPSVIAATAHVFAFFKDIPPGLGLLGTVIGVVKSFGLSSGRITAESAAAGLGVACYTTIAGLIICLVASVCEYVFQWAAGSAERKSSGDRGHV